MAEVKLALELEYLRADQELLRQEVDSMNRSMREQSLLVSTLVMTLKNMSVID